MHHQPQQEKLTSYSYHTNNDDADDEESSDDGGTVSSSQRYHGDDNPDERPDPGAFKYNRQVAVVSLPAFCLVLVFTGEILLCLLAVGSAVVSMLTSSGNKRRAVVMYLLFFVLSQIVVIYSAFPIIWLSVLNIFLLMLINVYSAMTGCWMIIQLEAFRKAEPELAMLIEKFLFSVYPGCCITLVTWFICLFVSPLKYAALIFLLYGFVVFQLFLSNCQSSFELPVTSCTSKASSSGSSGTSPSSSSSSSSRHHSERHILDSAWVGLVALLYCLMPMMIHVFISIIHGFLEIFRLSTLVDAVFIGSLSVFLTSLLNIRHFIESCDIPFRRVLQTRWICASIAALFSLPMMHSRGLTSLTLSWLPLTVCIHSAYGLILGIKNPKVWWLSWLAGGRWLAGGLILLFYYCMTSMYFPATVTHSYWVYLLLVLNGFCSMMCMASIGQTSSDITGLLFNLQSTVLVLTESALYILDLYTDKMILASSLIVLYLMVRLNHFEIISSKTAMFCTSCHGSKLMVISGVLLSDHLHYNPSILSSGSVFLLVLVINRIIFFKSDEAYTQNNVYFYASCIYVSFGVNIPIITSITSKLISQSDYIPVDAIACWLIICGAATQLLPLSTVPRMKWLPRMSIFLGMVLLVVKPDLSLKATSVEGLGLSLTVPGVVAVFMLPIRHPPFRINILAALLCIFPAVTLSRQVHGIYEALPTLLHYIWQVCLLAQCLQMFKSRHNTVVIETRHSSVILRSLLALTSSVAAALWNNNLLLGIGQLEQNWTFQAGQSDQSWTTQTCVYIVCGVALSFSIVIKFLLLQKDLPRIIQQQQHQQPMLSIFGNSLTAISCTLLCILCPWTDFYRDLWICLSSVSLLCLHSDNILLKKHSHKNHMTPTIMVSICTLITAATYSSSVWEDEFSVAKIRGLMEMLVVIVTSTGHVLFVKVLWSQTRIHLHILIVFVSPLNALLFVFASSAAAWMLGVVGMVTSVWMMTYKLSPRKVKPPQKRKPQRDLHFM